MESRIVAARRALLHVCIQPSGQTIHSFWTTNTAGTSRKSAAQIRPPPKLRMMPRPVGLVAWIDEVSFMELLGPQRLRNGRVYMRFSRV
jgi:hypothetical protein